MKKGSNINHPPKGAEIKVQPIKQKSDIELIKQNLFADPRNFALFTIGINTNLRASDILNLKTSQVKNLFPEDSIEIREKKTKKTRMVTFNKACVDAIRRHLASNIQNDCDLLFLGQRGPLTVAYVNRLVKEWCRSIKLQGNYGSHTLRKTWGYHQRVSFGVDIMKLMICFNHSTQRQTLSYLGIQPSEIREVFKNEI